MDFGKAGTAEGSPLTFPKVLHFLQKEWATFTRERTWWQAEKAELQARVAFLEGQRLGEANLKRDLLRRIKMLEHALTSERAKNNGDGGATAPYNSEEEKKPSASREIREGRQILLQYLSEMQYTDQVIEAQSQRIRGMLDSWSPAKTPTTTEPLPPLTIQTKKSDSEDGDNSDEDDNDDDDDSGPTVETDDDEFVITGAGNTKTIVIESIDPNEHQDIPDEMPLQPPTQQRSPKPPPLQLQPTHDGATESTTDDADDQEPTNEEEEDAELQKRIAANFNGGRMGKKYAKKRTARKHMGGQTFLAEPSEKMSAKMEELFDFDSDTPSTEKTTIEPATVEPVGADKKWKQKREFRGHLDSVRSAKFHPKEPMVVSVSEDALVKVWRTDGKRSCTSEPLRTLRGHTGPVLASAFTPSGAAFFTAGADAKIISWDLPDADCAKYVNYNTDPRLCCTDVPGGDTTWMLDTHSSASLLVSGGASGKLRLWDTSDASDLRLKSEFDCARGAISCGQFPLTDSGVVTLGHRKGSLAMMDIESGKVIKEFLPEDGDNAQLVNLRTHGQMSLVVGAFDDKTIRFYDIKSGKLVDNLVAHQAAVTSLDFDPSGLYVVSSGHDRSIRMWDVTAKKCVFETTTHRHKFDEAIHSVAFHPTIPKFVSAGADAIVKIYE